MDVASRRRVLGGGAALLVAPRTAWAQAVSLDVRAVLVGYADLAEIMFGEALRGARSLGRAVDALLAEPGLATLRAARDAWIAGRLPYSQTEGFRFGNKIVDAWEGRVNAWPLDEGLIDYVDVASYGESSDENPLYRANVIANTRIRVGRDWIDATTIDKELLGKLHEAGGVEANVAQGYHAIEFLLWGQDLNGTGPGAGDRPATDYSESACTGGNCGRRRTYLKVATDLLVEDLDEMARAWAEGGAARAEHLARDEGAGLAAILTGIGSLSYGELAGERMKLGLLLHSPEEEHDCFSDNTHNSHYFNQIGMVAIYTGRYERPDGRIVEKPGLSALARVRAPAEAAALDGAMTLATAKLLAIKARADARIEAYDQMLAEGNVEGNRMIQEGVDALVAQARAVEKLVARLGLTIKLEGSTSLDNPSAAGDKKAKK